MLETSYERDGYDGITGEDDIEGSLAPEFVRAGWDKIDLANAVERIADATGDMEERGYVGKNVEWWFEAWGRDEKAKWQRRRPNRLPPTPSELVEADYIVFGFRSVGSPYRTHVGGLDLL